MKTLKLSLFLTGLLCLSTTAQATLVNEKVTLKPNMIIEYNKLPASVDTLSEAFSEGSFYGKLRLNSFLWDWKDDTYPSDPNGKLMDNKVMGYGGSLIYKTAPISGISATVAGYTSQNPGWFRESQQDVGYVKAGKDTFSRYDVSADGNYGMSVIGQAYLQYDISKTTIIAGKQMFESVFTASNDTKMIPNTFDGITATIKEIPDTTIKLAYLDKQKLRDHTKSHDVIAFKGGSTYDKWSENDDAGVNKNLTVALIGDDNELIIATATNKSVKNLKLNLSYATVPDVVSNLTFESHYTIPITGKWKVVPGLRYMQQFDNLSSSAHAKASLTTSGGVASLNNSSHVGYTNPNSLDSNLLALRVDIKNNAFLARFGYSKVADKADIVAPWRGFPTGGFTRAMAQYNWLANTKTYMFRAGYDFDKAKIIPGFSVMARYAIQDFDDKKDGIPFTDSKVIHIDFRQNITQNLEAKVRLGFVNADDNVMKSNGTLKSDLSYNEYRFELNYLF